MMRLLVTVMTLFVGTGLSQSSGKANTPCDEICKRGACIYEGCEQSISCPGGACEFINCYQPECPGGACRFYSSIGATCKGGGCQFHKLSEELDAGHCVGGGCLIHDGPQANVVAEVSMDETQTRAIVNEPEELKPVETAAAAEPAAIDEASAAVQSEPELIPEVALETEIVTEPESEPEPVPEKKSRFGRAKRAE